MTASPASILVVDDLADNRELLTLHVQRYGHRVTTAGNGREALELLAHVAFDLIFLDIMMPEMNGFDVLQKLQADERLRHIPVIMISALNDVESVVRCVDLGAEDYLFKPFNAILLRARLHASLEKKRLRDNEQEAIRQLKVEQERSEKLLLSIFPKSIADRLRTEHQAIAEHYERTTILFANISEFSRLAEPLRPTAVIEMLNTVFSAFDRLAQRFGVDKIKTIGDTYMAAAGAPRPRADHAEAIAEMALAMQLEAVRLTTNLREPVNLRIGIDSGPVVAGVVGTTRFAYDLWGATVSRASRMESFGVAGGIQVTARTQALLDSKYLLEQRGSFYIPGQGEVTTYLLKGKRQGMN